MYNTTPSLTKTRPKIFIISGRTNISAEDTILYLSVSNMSSPISSRRKLLLKRKQSSLNNEIFACTRCVTFGIINYKTVEGSSYCCGYVAVGYLCDHEVTEHHF